LRFFLDRFATLAADHADDLPAGVVHPTALIGDSAHIANQALHRLRVWSAQVDFRARASGAAARRTRPPVAAGGIAWRRCTGPGSMWKGVPRDPLSLQVPVSLARAAAS